MTPPLTNDQRRMLYRATHRGMKENDLLLGGFATTYLGTLTDAETTAFDVLLEELDADVLDWVMARKPLPPHIDVALFDRILAFKPYA